MRKAWGIISGICVLWTTCYLATSLWAFCMFYIAAVLDWLVAFFSQSVVVGITMGALVVTLATLGRAITKAIFSKEN